MTKRMLIGAPSVSESAAEIVPLKRFSAQSFANWFCTVSVISSVDRPSTRIGLIQVSKIGFVKRLSSATNVVCQRYSSLVIAVAEFITCPRIKRLSQPGSSLRCMAVGAL